MIEIIKIITIILNCSDQYRFIQIMMLINIKFNVIFIYFFITFNSNLNLYNISLKIKISINLSYYYLEEIIILNNQLCGSLKIELSFLCLMEHKMNEL